jgi:hypothetical protein
LIAKYNNQFLIVALGALILLPFLGGVHLFDWDEINFAESSREMMIILGKATTVFLDSKH